MVGEMTGKSVLVTGGGSGIGRATALAFAKAGAWVGVMGRRLDMLDETSSLVQQLGGRCLSVGGDVTRERDVENAVGKMSAEYGRLDCAFNNAGALPGMGRLADLSETDLRSSLEVNVMGTFLCMKHEIRQMLGQGQGGAIVNCASLSAVLGTPGGSAYNASKHAVLGLTRCAALDYVGDDIRINAVCPGSIMTDMLATFMAAEGAERIEARTAAFVQGIPAGRLGRPEEIARTVLWLCSEGASFVIGQAILVDGGATVL